VAVGSLGPISLALIAAFGLPAFDYAQGGRAGVALAGLLLLAFVSQLWVVAGTYLACRGARPVCCGSGRGRREVHFRISEYDEVAHAALEAGPWTLLQVLDAAPAAAGDREVGAVELEVCAECGHAGPMRLTKRRWCDRHARFEAFEDGPSVQRPAWVVCQLAALADRSL